MRWTEILTESVAKYKPMFASYYPEGVPGDVLREIGRIETAMGREDRVVWMLRWYRFSELGFDLPAAHASTSVTGTIGDQRSEAEMAKKMLKRLTRDLSDKPLEIYTLRNESDKAMNMEHDLAHYFSLPIHGIKTYVFHKQLPSEILEAFEQMEEEWKETRGNVVTLQGNEEMVIDFHNGWAWWNLNRGYCTDEGDAMGHCGNEPSEQSGDRVFSLREHIHEDDWSPHLTFIVDGDGFIGEMKGRGNEKPVERYHAMIIALLKSDEIFGIKGGGYKPENNFSLDDLTTAEAQMLRETKPGFRTISELVRDEDWDSLKIVIDARLGNRKFESIDYKAQDVVVETWTNIESYCRYEFNDYNNTFEAIEEELSSEEDGAAIYASFYADYYARSLKEHIYDFKSFMLDIGVNIDTVDSPVSYTLSFRGVDAIGDPDEGNENIDELADLHDWDRFQDGDSIDYFDDIDELLCKYIAGNTNSWNKKNNDTKINDVVSAILAEYNAEAGTTAWGSRTVNDPNQLNFDFNKK